MVEGNREGSRFTAGGGKTLGIIRYGREEMNQTERIAGDDIYPGQALQVGTDEEGSRTFEHHDGGEKTVYVAVEARGRGMDAQTDDPYAEGEDYVIAVRASGGGLNLMVADGENVEDGDALVPDEGTGYFVVGDDADSFAEADEHYDLSGADAPALVKGEVNN